MNLKIGEKTSKGFYITWKQPEYIPGDLGKYQIVIKNIGPNHFIPDDYSKNPPPIEIKYAIENTSFNFSYAQPDYKYEVKVAASTQAGFGLENTISIITSSGKFIIFTLHFFMYA